MERLAEFIRVEHLLGSRHRDATSNLELHLFNGVFPPTPKVEVDELMKSRLNVAFALYSCSVTLYNLALSDTWRRPGEERSGKWNILVLTGSSANIQGETSTSPCPVSSAGNQQRQPFLSPTVARGSRGIQKLYV